MEGVFTVWIIVILSSVLLVVIYKWVDREESKQKPNVTKFAPALGGLLIMVCIPILVIMTLTTAIMGVTAGTRWVWNKTTAPESGNVTVAPTHTIDPDLQARRKAIIDEAISQGLLYKIDTTSFPHLYVTDEFFAMPIDRKHQFAVVVFDYYYPDGGKDDDIVVFYQYQTGKKIGACSKSGLTLY